MVTDQAFWIFTKSNREDKLLDDAGWRKKTVENASKVNSKAGQVDRPVQGGGCGVEGAGGGECPRGFQWVRFVNDRVGRCGVRGGGGEG